MQRSEGRPEGSAISFLADFTAPLFIQDHFLSTGHDHRTSNGTVTFIKFNGRHYACTNKHVVNAVQSSSINPGASDPTAALMFGRAVLNFSDHTPNGFRSSFRSPVFTDYRPSPDISISPIDVSWELIARNGKKAIDLDKWEEPPWDTVKMCVAVGYPTEHKVIKDETVAATVLLVLAELASTITHVSNEFTMCSTLEEPHGYFFSGISGGPIFAMSKEGKHTIIGMTFESALSNDRRPSEADSFAGPNDILIRGLPISPQRFSHWLRLCGLQRNNP
jgi:hypothetical protein